jgi:hypothetical protein
MRQAFLLLALLGACVAPADDRPASPAEDHLVSPAADRSSSPAESAVLEVVEAWYRALSAVDQVAMAEHFWPGATITTTWQPEGEGAPRVVIDTAEAFVAKAPEGPGSQPIFDEWLTGSKVQVFGNLAQVWADYDARFGSEEQVMEWSGVDGFTLMEHDGRWKIVALAFAAER